MTHHNIRCSCLAKRIKTAKSTFQKYKNKCLRLVTNGDRYTKITDLHRLANILTIDQYINALSENKN